MSNAAATFFTKWKMHIGIITTVLGLAAGIFAFDDRYAKAKTFTTDIDRAKIEIISRLESEVGRNRAAMVNNMQRDADDLEYEMSVMRDVGTAVPRYMIEKHRQLVRDIRDLQR